MPKKEALKEEAQDEDSEALIGLKAFKRPTYVLALLLSSLGILVALVLVFVINDALDKTQASINSNLDGISALLGDAGSTAGTLEGEISALNNTFRDVNASVSSLSDGMSGTGTTMKQFGATLSQMNVMGVGFSQYGAQLSESGDSILNGSARLREVGALSEHAQKLGELQSSVGAIRADLADQQLRMSQTKQSISGVIGLIKIADILVFVMFVTMFIVLMLNSAAGIL